MKKKLSLWADGECGDEHLSKPSTDKCFNFMTARGNNILDKQ